MNCVFLLKEAKADELLKLVDISKNAFLTDYLVGGEPNDGPPDFDNVEWHKKMLDEKHLYSFYVDDELVGGAVLYKSDNILYFCRIFIDPTHFRKGYGRQLMLEIEKLYEGITLFKLDTPVWNIRTNALYQSLGYKEVSRTEEDIKYYKIIKEV